MQIVEVDLIDGFPFYCPVTGEQILTEDDFNPSPAMVYCYLQDESEFNMILEPYKKLFGIESIESDEIYMDYDDYDKALSSLVTFEETKNWVCFRICQGGSGWGSSVVDHCIDMGYRKKS